MDTAPGLMTGDMLLVPGAMLLTARRRAGEETGLGGPLPSGPPWPGACVLICTAINAWGQGLLARQKADGPRTCWARKDMLVRHRGWQHRRGFDLQLTCLRPRPSVSRKSLAAATTSLGLQDGQIMRTHMLARCFAPL